MNGWFLCSLSPKAGIAVIKSFLDSTLFSSASSTKRCSRNHQVMAAAVVGQRRETVGTKQGSKDRKKRLV